MPFYNDFENFKEFIQKIESIKEPLPIFLVIDNGSISGDIKHFYETHKDEKKLVWDFVKFEDNKGFGGAIKHSTQFFEEDYIAWMPGNMKVDPMECFNMVKTHKYSYLKLIKARRIGRSFIDSLKTFIFSSIMSARYNKILFDNGGTPNIMYKKLLDKVNFAPNDFSFDLFIFYFFKYKNLEIARPKIFYKKRLHGNSHWQKGFVSEFILTKNMILSKKSWIKNIKKADLKELE